MGRKEEDNKTERMIVAVEKNPCIYDKQSDLYKDTKKKDDIWKEVSENTGFSVPDAKQRWKAVRDNYRKYKNSLKSKSGQGAKAVAPYKFSGILGFLAPFLKDRESSSNLCQDALQPAEMDKDANDEASAEQARDDGDGEDFTNEDIVPISQSHSSHPTTPTLQASANRKQKSSKNDTVDEAIADFLTEKKKYIANKRIAPVEDKDHIDHFMLSMAATIRKLPARAKADLKYKIHGIVHEAEMKYLLQNEHDFNPPPFSYQNMPASFSQYGFVGPSGRQAQSTSTTATTQGHCDAFHITHLQ